MQRTSHRLQSVTLSINDSGIDWLVANIPMEWIKAGMIKWLIICIKVHFAIMGLLTSPFSSACSKNCTFPLLVDLVRVVWPQFQLHLEVENQIRCTTSKSSFVLINLHSEPIISLTPMHNAPLDIHRLGLMWLRPITISFLSNFQWDMHRISKIRFFFFSFFFKFHGPIWFKLI